MSFAPDLPYDNGFVDGMERRMVSRILLALVLLGSLAACGSHRVIGRDFGVACSSFEVAGGAGERLWVEVLDTPQEDWDAAALSATVIQIFRCGGAS